MTDEQGIIYSEDGKVVLGVTDDFDATEVIIPEGVIDISPDAFNEKELSKVVLPSTLKRIGDLAFVECGNQLFKIVGDFEHLTLYGGAGKWSDSPINVRNIKIENVDTFEIGDEAFKEWKSLEEVVIPKSVVAIRERAFSGCRNLREVIVYNPEIEIGECAFLNCSKLISVHDADGHNIKGVNIWNTGLGSGLCEFYRNLQSRLPVTVETGNGEVVSFDMILVEGGTKSIGLTPEQNATELDYLSYNGPFEVTLSDYYIGETPVTKSLWFAVMGENPDSSIVEGPDSPVVNISYSEIQRFIKKLRDITGLNFALPTIAQWEYAARGGVKSKNFIYAGSNKVDEVAWTKRYTDARWDEMSDVEKALILEYGLNPMPVKRLKPNELGLYDMSGNVWEFCCDSPRLSNRADYDIENPSHLINPILNSCSSENVALKGGCIQESERKSQVSSQITLDVEMKYTMWGFRLVIDNRYEEYQAKEQAVLNAAADYDWDEVISKLLCTQLKEQQNH